MNILFFCSKNFFLNEEELKLIPDLYEKGKTVEGGRGSSRLVDFKERTLFIKKERRGGFFSFFLKEYFFRVSPFFKIVNILYSLDELNITPRLMAIIARKRYFLWEIFTVYEHIENAISLKDYLHKNGELGEYGYEVGFLVGKIHNKGIYHADLNLGNIIFKKDNFYIIDFKKSYYYSSPLPIRLRKKNILRFLRSIAKESFKKGVHFDSEFFEDFLKGYNAHFEEKIFTSRLRRNFLIFYYSLKYLILSFNNFFKSSKKDG